MVSAFSFSSRGFAALVLPLVLAGCISTGSENATSSGTPRDPLEPVARTLFGVEPARGEVPDINKTKFEGEALRFCPEVEGKFGAGVMAQAKGGQLAAQATLGQLARECSITGQIFTIKVGVEGRIIAGPAGEKGVQLDLPLRIALIEGGPSQKVVQVRQTRIRGTLAAGQPNGTFTHVEPDITFPLPSPEVLERYVVQVGFDTSGGQPEKKPRRR